MEYVNVIPASTTQIITDYLGSNLLDAFAKQLTGINGIYEFPIAEKLSAAHFLFVGTLNR